MFYIQVHIKLQTGWKFSSQKAFFSWAVIMQFGICLYAVLKAFPLQGLQLLNMYKTLYCFFPMISLHSKSHNICSCLMKPLADSQTNSLLHDFVHLWFNPHHLPWKEFCHLKLFLVYPPAVRFIIISFLCYVILFLISWAFLWHPGSLTFLHYRVYQILLKCSKTLSRL